MKTLITNYTFDASAQTVTLVDYNPVSLASVLLITNVTDNIIIYNFADPAAGGIVSGSIITLDYNTTAMDDSDKLMIYYDDTSISAATAEQQENISALIETLNSLVNVLSPLGSAMNSGPPGLRVTPNAATLPISGSVTATVATTSITNFGTGIPAKEMADDINNLLVTMGNLNNITT